MLSKNMGGLDRTARFIAGVVLIPVGLFLLGGWKGNALGIVVAVFALIPLVTSLAGICPAYLPFHVSTRRG